MNRLFLAILLTACGSTLAADPFAEFVRTTEAKSPADEQKTFHLPDGFEIQLVTSDPEIGKPMNLAFDSRGRLWVTDTHLYPMPAADASKKTDAIKVIELGEDGRATKITTFATGLDIPIGVYPVTNGDSVIAYDINNVCRYTDTDGDGKSDKREVLYAGWGYERDTHGMASNFRRGFDGWLYGCHGFNNISAVKGSDGQVMNLRSGNTYRMRLDGSHIEAFTIGQINPFGMCLDPLGNIYTSDSHSKPIYQLLRGGRYEAFDRDTNDGLGLAPRMMEHLHGSTAIAGSQFYAAELFPEEFRGNVFTGNVMTSRINRDKLEYRGSSPRAIEQPDFLRTDDPWFRPVQTVMGPDGALYVADFYNRIIGHYEVKLDDPRRDLDRGRIWRITYKGAKPAKLTLDQADVSELIAKLDDPNLMVRMLAMGELSDRIGRDSIEPLTTLLESGKATSNQKIHGLWTLYRLSEPWRGLLQQVAVDPDASVRVHVMRVLAETPKWLEEMHSVALKGLSDDNALVRRCAADALGLHPDSRNVRPLLDTLASADKDDTHLVYVLRQALRNQLKAEGAYAKLGELSGADVRTIADVSLAVESSDAATFLLDHVMQLGTQKDSLTRYLRHAVRFSSAPNVAPLAAMMREKFADDLDLQLDLFQSVRQGLEQRGQTMPESARQWGQTLAGDALKNTPTTVAWTNTGFDATAAVVNPWDYEIRLCGDTQRKPILSSLPGGETTTAVLRSQPFSIPEKLSFYLAGHTGPPALESNRKSFVRLKDAGTNETIVEVFPPREDIARRVEWDLKAQAGKQGYLEVTDGDTGTGYAWIAFGRFDPPIVPMPEVPLHAVQKRLQTAAELAGALNLTSVAPDLVRNMLDRNNDTETRSGMATSVAMLKADTAVPAMKQIIGSSDEVMVLRERVAGALGVMATPAAREAIVESFRLSPRELQTSLAIALTSNTDSAETLLDAVAKGQAPPGLLLDLGIHDRLAAARVPDLDKRVKQLTKGVAAPKEELEKLIVARRAEFKAAKSQAANGQAVFAKNCVMCHQIDGKGALVGPQLVGLSKRGIDRLVEDVLDPNRNVDPAFKYSTLILKDGRLITGLQRRQDGEVLVFSDTLGKEVSVQKKDIQQRIESPSSLMPGNFAEIIAPGDFNDLMAYLLSK